MAALRPNAVDDRELLRNLALDLIHPAQSKTTLIRQITALRQLIERRSSLPDPNEIDLGAMQTRLDAGLAISPVKAALCARECFRTIAFVR